MNLDTGMVNLISLGITTLGGIVLAFIAFKTASIGKTVEKVAKQTDGITSALVASTAKASHAEGKVDGKEELKAEQKQEAVKPPP